MVNIRSLPLPVAKGDLNLESYFLKERFTALRDAAGALEGYEHEEEDL